MELREATCPACGHHIAVPFLASAPQPLATLAWPKSEAEARALPRLPLDFVRCVDCGHVYNAAFDYAAVPYSEQPNLMFNRGQIWSEFIAGVQQEIAHSLPARATVVEIGYGDGSFLSALSRIKPDASFVGFDPNGATDGDPGGCSFRRELFRPSVHLAELRPHLIVSRHVLEHLSNPLGFLQSINFAAACLSLPVRMYFEVPCIDRAIRTLRTVDFYYEHSSQFTSRSFERMLQRSGMQIESVGFGYSREVVHAFVRATVPANHLTLAAQARHFAEGARCALSTISLQLLSLQVGGKRTAIWGGTGKSAAFLNRYGLDRERFPIVVDSDPAKEGTYVPGTGQRIRFRDYLIGQPVEIIVIPPQWRAEDIVREIRAAGITFETVLIEHNGQLVDFFRGTHPYRTRPASSPDPVEADSVADSGLVRGASDLESHVPPIG